MKAITGFDILVEGTENTYKDLYDIFEGISGVWDKLSDTQQARVAEILGGTRQLQVISSILANWSDAVNAYDDAMNSAGTATEANDRYMESIQGHIGQLKASWQELASSTFTRDAITDIIDLGRALVEGPLTGIGKLIDQIGVLKVALAGLAVYGYAKQFGSFGDAMGATFGKVREASKYLNDMRIQAAAAGKSFGAFKTVTTWFGGLSKAIFGSTIALKALAISAAAIAGVLWAADNAIFTYDEAAEAAEKATEEFNMQRENVESLNSELETTQTRIDELQAKGSLTLTEQTELSNLQAQNQLLETQLEYEERLQELKGRVAANAIGDKLSDQSLVYHSDTYELKELGWAEAFKIGMAGIAGAINLVATALGHSIGPLEEFSRYFSDSFQADSLGATEMMLDQYEALLSQKKAYEQEIRDLGPNADTKKYQDVVKNLTDTQSQIDMLEASLSVQMDSVEADQKTMLDAGLNGDNKYLRQLQGFIDRYTDLSSSLSLAEEEANARQSKINDALKMPELSESVDTLTQIAKEVNGLTEGGFTALLNEFPELARVIGETCGLSEEELDGLDERFNGKLGTGLATAMKSGTDDAKAIWSGFIDTLNSEAGTVNYDSMRRQLVDMYGEITPEGTSRDWNELNEFKEVIAQLDNEQIEILFNLGYDVKSLKPEEVRDRIKEIQDAASEAEHSVDGIAESVNKFTTGVSSVQSAMSSGGTLDYDTYNSEELVDYADALEYVNGEYQYNSDLVEAVTEAKREELKTTINLEKQQRKQQYDENAKAIEKYTDALEGATEEEENFYKSRIDYLKGQQDDILQEIQSLDVLSAQLDNTFSKYAEWKNMKNAPSKGEMFNDITEAFNTIYDTLYNGESDIYGKIGEADYQSALNLLLPDADMTRAEIDSWFNTFSEYWIKDSEGKFTDKLNLQKVQDKLIGDGFMDAETLFLKEGTSLDDLAASFGTTKDAMWSFLQYWNQFLDEAHQFKLEDLDLGLEESADQIGERVTQAVESLKSVGVLSEGLDIDLDLSGYDTVEDKVSALDDNLSQLSRAKVEFEEDSASYALIEGSMRDIIAMKAEVEHPLTLSIDTSSIDSDLGEIYSALYEYDQAAKQIQSITKSGETLGIDVTANIEALEQKQEEAKNKLAELSESPWMAELDIDPNSLKSIEDAISNQDHPYNIYVRQHIVDAAGNEITGEGTEEEQQTIEVTAHLDREEVDDFLDESLTKDVPVTATLEPGAAAGVQTQFDEQMAESGGLNATVNVTMNQDGDTVQAEDGTATVTYVVNDDAVDAFLARNINRSAVVTYSCYHNAVDSFLRTLGNRTYTITYRVRTIGGGSGDTGGNTNPNGYVSKNGLNDVLGTAYAKGTWGTKRAGEYLVGELGRKHFATPHSDMRVKNYLIAGTPLEPRHQNRGMKYAHMVMV